MASSPGWKDGGGRSTKRGQLAGGLRRSAQHGARRGGISASKAAPMRRVLRLPTWGWTGRSAATRSASSCRRKAWWSSLPFPTTGSALSRPRTTRPRRPTSPICRRSSIPAVRPTGEAPGARHRLEFALPRPAQDRLRRSGSAVCSSAATRPICTAPAGGQGMNTGIQDAVSLAAPLTRALKRNAAPESLTSASSIPGLGGGREIVSVDHQP